MTGIWVTSVGKWVGHIVILIKSFGIFMNRLGHILNVLEEWTSIALILQFIPCRTDGVSLVCRRRCAKIPQVKHFVWFVHCVYFVWCVACAKGVTKCLFVAFISWDQQYDLLIFREIGFGICQETKWYFLIDFFEFVRIFGLEPWRNMLRWS